jgi:hypothetical protein
MTDSSGTRDVKSEYNNFTRLLDQLLKVPHSKIKAAMEDEKREKRMPRKRAVRGHAYRDTD